VVDETASGVMVVTAEQRVAVEERLRRTDLSRRERERLEMVKAAALGYDAVAIARWSGRTARTVRRWLRRFAAAGADALRDAPRPGRPVKAGAAYRAALEQAVTTVPTGVGLPFDVWTSARLSAYLAEQTGVRVAPGWVRALLNRQDFVCGRPKHTLDHLQDPADIERFLTEVTAAGEKGRGRAGPV
jgi:transposase